VNPVVRIEGVAGATTWDPKPCLKFMGECYGADVVAKLDGLRTGFRKVLDEELRLMLEQYQAIV
jgi:hypothetical protein